MYIVTNLPSSHHQDIDMHAVLWGCDSGIPLHRYFFIFIYFLGRDSYTGIHALADVKRSLKGLVDWQSLGLELGLLYPTLKRIKKEQREDINDCMMEMLAAWLQQQDDVAKKGVPSWLTLKAALMNIDEKKLADSIIIT